ncbi:MAG: M23 family metallopeptidase [Hyphomicrobiaceae bacterium]|nr:M23 family metallopeptidase [Hyphomicrobiaceae bacterium]
MFNRCGVLVLMLSFGFGLACDRPATAQDSVSTFKVNPPGVLRDKWGDGIRENKLYAEGMTFPVRAPTTLNSQVRGKGGMFNPGNQCAAENYNEVWWDTYCEKRGASGRLSICSSGAIHQGLDIRGGTVETCERYKSRHETYVEAVATYDGRIVKIGSFSVDLETDRHGSFRYLHLDMKRLQVGRGDRVRAGQTLGYIASDFGKAGKNQTTQHLHLEHRVVLNGAPPRRGFKPVPLYCDMVAAYERTGRKAIPVGDGLHCRMGGPGAAPPPGGDAGPVAGTTSGAGASRYASLWTHRGSTLGLVASGARRAFEYVEPRPGLPQIIKPGTVLFDGTTSGDRYSGRAFEHSERCGAQSFDVAGPIENGRERVVLKGQRPIPGAHACEPDRFSPDTLVFNFSRALGPPAPQPVPPGGPAGGTATGPAAGPAGSPVTASGQIIKTCTRDTCVDRNAFVAKYADLYRREQRKPLNVYQEAALNAVINVWDTTPDLVNYKRLAYILATVYHESFHLIYPIRECKCVKDEGSVACVRKLHARGIASAYHRRHQRTHHSYYGRGQTQLTLDVNFSKITDNLGLRAKGVDLFAVPDAALQLDISAMNAVLGLYRGWYRGRHRLAANDFLTPLDWIRARDVLIAQRRHADRVAAHGQAIYKILAQNGMLISRAAFEAKYVKPAAAAAGPSEPVVPAAPVEPLPPPAPVAPAKPDPPVQVTAPPSPDTVAAPASPSASSPTGPSPAAPIRPPALAKIASEAAQLAKATADLRVLADDLDKRASILNARINDLIEDQQAAGTGQPTANAVQRRAITPDAGSAAPVSAKSANIADGVLDPTVDFKTKWPQSHKQLPNWCDDTPADRKATRKLLSASDPEDKELLDRYTVAVLTPDSRSATGRSKSLDADDGVDLQIRIGARSPQRVGAEGQPPGQKAAGGGDQQSGAAFWTLPLLPVAKGDVRTLAPRRVEVP